MALQITQTKSSNGAKANQRRTLESLGLRRMHQTVVVADRPEIRGMAHKVTHLVRVEEVSDDLLPNGGKSKYRSGKGIPSAEAKVPLAQAGEADADAEE